MSEITGNKLAEATAAQTAEEPIASLLIFLLGLFPCIFSKSRNELTIDMTCLLIWKKKVYPLIIMAYGEAVQRLEGLTPFHLYETDIEIRQDGDLYKAKMDKQSTFTEVDRERSDEIIKKVLSFYPHIPLVNAKNHLSMLEKNGNEFEDKTDLKILQVYLNNITYGTSEHGIEWARLEVVDKSFNPTDRPFIAWVNPQILRDAGTGKGSFVYLLGTLEHDGYENTQMSVCNILPIVKRPLKPEINSNPERILKISME